MAMPAPENTGAITPETSRVPAADADVSRRSLLKHAAVGGVRLVAGGSLVAGVGAASARGDVERVAAKDEWFRERAWCVSGNRLLTGDGAPPPAMTRAREVYRPRSAREIADLVAAAPAGTSIACVCGGHESSNAALFASSEAIVLDLAHLKSIEFHRDDEGPLVTVGAGVVFRELVEQLKEHCAALPVGTGPGVGVVGYIVNGGLSGYFSRRLGLLGQRVVKMTIVTAAGEIRVLGPGDELFTAMLGAGSALGIVVDVTLRTADAGVVQGAEQRIIAFETRDQAVAFSRRALAMQRDRVLPDDTVSMELVVTGEKVLVATFVFYDSFRGSAADVVAPLEAIATDMKLPIVAKPHLGSWYEAAAALWPVIAKMKGAPLAMLQHCMGTRGVPDDRILDFICEQVVARAPLDEAAYSIVEIRTLGGAALSAARIPTGNCQHRFFVDLIAMYDAKDKPLAERRAIADAVGRIVDEARGVDGLSVDFSGTHSQPDDGKSAASPAVIFGTEALAESVRAQKRKVDPDNRFRFHPFAKFL